MKINNCQKEPIDAIELRAKIKEDLFYIARWAGYVERIKQMQQAFEEYREAAAPILEEFSQVGYNLDRLSDLYKKKIYTNKTTYQRAVPILLRWLPRINNLNVREDIVRPLSVNWPSLPAPAFMAEFLRAPDYNEPACFGGLYPV